MSRPFAQILAELAELCGAVQHSGRPSSVPDSTSFIDTIELAGYEDDEFIGQRLFIWEGTGIGQERTVTDSAGSSSDLTVPAWDPDPIASVSRYILLHRGWRMDNFRAAFKVAMHQLREHYMIPVVDESLSFAVTGGTITYEYTIPSYFVSIEKILRENTDGSGDFWTNIPPDYWYVNKDYTRQLVFEKEANDRDGFIKDGLAIQITGQRFEIEPDNDSDVLVSNVGNIMMLAAYYALTSARTRNVNNIEGYGAMANIYYQRYLEGRGDSGEVMINPGGRRVDV